VVMNYLAKHKNVTTMLTTHYADLCKKLEKKENMKNCHMKVLKTEDNFEYTYLLEEGISIVKGGVKVLMDMDYPQEIIDNANKTASN
jgi:DNA mismatch repair ATPase MutS